MSTEFERTIRNGQGLLDILHRRSIDTGSFDLLMVLNTFLTVDVFCN